MTQKEKEICKWFFNLVRYFNHYSFFTKKLWREVKGFEKYDESEIKCAFMHYWFHCKFGYFTYPCGCGWFAELDEKSYNDYIKRCKPIIKAFEQWKIEQR